MGVELNHVVLSLGANLGNPQRQIKLAYEQIEERVGVILLKSSFYKSEPWGFQSDSKFTNTAIYIETKLQMMELLEACQRIEKELGRQPQKSEKYESRLIDIDIIDFSGEVLSSQLLDLPHPIMHLRLFVLEPMLEILPDWRHPVFNKTCRELILDISQSKD